MRGMTSLVESLAPTAATPTTVDIAMALSSARTAEECLLVAAQAEALGAVGHGDCLGHGEAHW